MEQQSNKSGINLKFIAIALLIGIGGFGLWRIVKKLSGGAADANLSSEDINDLSTAQAATFFGLFGVERHGSLSRATPVVKDTTKTYILALSKNIADWKKVQSEFTGLCGDDYTILQAASDSLNTTYYRQFVDNVNDAVNKAMMFAKSDIAVAYHDVSNRNNGVLEFNKGEYIGRCQGTNGNFYSFYWYKTGAIFYIEKKFVDLKAISNE